jgi:hypothetical protein|tara:strand:- start:56 stop:463 length:408 start_codon:yes stop_codon:yes gene_type:complete
MSLCRVWYRADEKIFITHISWNMKPVGQTDQEFFDAEMAKILLKNPGKYASMDFEDVDSSTLPEGCVGAGHPKSVRWKRDKLRGNKAKGIRFDNTIRIRKDVEDELDTELDSPSPDMKKVAKLERKLRKKDYSPL